MIELGRACVHANHRNLIVLHLLWRGIAKYAIEHDARFLVGCSSFTSQDPAEGAAVYEQLRQRFLVRPELQTLPQAEFRCDGQGWLQSRPASEGASARLLRAYLAIGAKICGPPAIDREFSTIDFLTLLDLDALPAIVRTHFLK